METENALAWLDEPKHDPGKDWIDLTPPGAKYTITTDLFHQIVTTGEPFIAFGQALDEYVYSSGTIVFRKLNFCSKMFNFGYEVFFKGKSFATVSVDPKKNGILKDNVAKFELKNNVQYEAGWLDDVKYFYRAMGWKVSNTSRVDIALDGRGFFDVYQKYVREEIDRKGASEIQEFRKAKRVLTGFDIGKRSSDKWITCYNKSAEINKSNKNYILKYWERSGLDTRNVERLELKLKNDALKEINFNWEKIDDFEYLASIFRTFIEGGFAEWVDTYTGEVIRKKKIGMMNFIERSEDKNISRKKKIRFINWDYIGGVPLERFSTEKTSEVWAMKVTIKKMIQLSVACDQRAQDPFQEDRLIYSERSQAFRIQAYEMAENINALDWLIEHFDEWKQNYSRQKFKYIPGFKVSHGNEQLKLTSTDVLEKLLS